MKMVISSEMKQLNRGRSGRIAPKNLGLVAVLTCLILPCIFLFVIKPNLDSFSIRTEILKKNNAGTEKRSVPLALKAEKGENQSSNAFDVNIEMTNIPLENKPKLDTNVMRQSISYRGPQTESTNITSVQMAKPATDIADHQMESKPNEDVNTTSLPVEMKIEDNNMTRNGNEMTTPIIDLEHQMKKISDEDPKGANSLHTAAEKQEPIKPLGDYKLSCDLSHQRSDTCSMRGDVRILAQSPTIILASKSNGINSTMSKIRPYARKWEPPVMETIKEVTLKSADTAEAPRCTVNHSVPAVVFSTGGFLGNFFHDFTDVLVPLFITSRQYQREVQFLATDFNPGWINKYRPILNRLSRYETINLDRGEAVHCFGEARIGLDSHRVLGVDPSRSSNGYSIEDFRELLRSAYSLKRKSISGSKRPRLLVLLRKGSRSLVNKKEVVGLGRRLGFKVVAAGPEETRNMSRFARVVNSCDVMMGVHGAGLTNMMFLPVGAAVVQVIPLGGLKWACWHDFGEPAPEMGVRYFEYEIRKEESSLIEQYPRDHPVFTDPLSIQKQGWNVLWSVFLDKQKVKLDVRRFRPLLQEAMQSVQH